MPDAHQRIVRAPRGPAISAKSWLTEAPLRLIMNNLDAEVAERPQDLVVYGGTGRAERDWQSFDRIVASLRDLEGDETLRGSAGSASATAIASASPWTRWRCGGRPGRRTGLRKPSVAWIQLSARCATPMPAATRPRAEAAVARSLKRIAAPDKD